MIHRRTRGRLQTHLRTVSLPTSPLRLGAAAAVLAALAALQALILFTPTEIVASTRTKGTPLGYMMRTTESGPDGAIALSLYFDGPVQRQDVEITLERANPTIGVDPIAAPRHRVLLAMRLTSVRFVLVPKVDPGTWKVRVGTARPFGVINVGR